MTKAEIKTDDAGKTIKVEIATDAGQYLIKLAQVATLKKAWEIVDETLRTGTPFEGDDGYLIIGPGASIKHIRIFEEHDDVGIPFMEDKDDADFPFTDSQYVFATKGCVFLGNKVHARGMAIAKNGHTWYLPMEVNNRPALDVIGPEKLEEFVVYWAMSNENTPGSFTVVVPKQQLPDYAEALEYLKDYIAETQEPGAPKENNARAWQGWKEGVNYAE